MFADRIEGKWIDAFCEVFDFDLTDDHMAKIASLDTGERVDAARDHARRHTVGSTSRSRVATDAMAEPESRHEAENGAEETRRPGVDHAG